MAEFYPEPKAREHCPASFYKVQSGRVCKLHQPTKHASAGLRR